MIDLSAQENWLHPPVVVSRYRRSRQQAKALRQQIEKAAYSIMAYTMVNEFSAEEGLFMADPARWHIERARFWRGLPSAFDVDQGRRADLLSRIAAQGFDDPGLLALAVERVMFEQKGLTVSNIVAKIKAIRSVQHG